MNINDIYRQFWQQEILSTEEKRTALRAYITSILAASDWTQPASGSLVFTVQKNNVGTAITGTLAAGAGAGTTTDLTNSVSFAAGDLIVIKVVNNATSASATISRHSLLATFE